MRKLSIVLFVVLALALLAAANPSPTLAAGPLYYVVRPGDTMDAIAMRYGVSTWSLARANGVWNPNLIYVGQMLVVPGSAYFVNPRPVYNPVVFYPRPTLGCFYWVRYGDTMSTIAWRFGGDPWVIARANGIYNLNWIYAGQRLFIPGCN